MYACDVTVMKGLTLSVAERTTRHQTDGWFPSGVSRDLDALRFVATNGLVFWMYHMHDCTEYVTLEDISGDLSDLVGVPLLMAEEVEGVTPPGPLAGTPFRQESETWTFYKFATAKGYVTIRWYGTSNGYYSESVDVFCSEQLCIEHKDCQSNADIALACHRSTAAGAVRA